MYWHTANLSPNTSSEASLPKLQKNFFQSAILGKKASEQLIHKDYESAFYLSDFILLPPGIHPASSARKWKHS